MSGAFGLVALLYAALAPGWLPRRALVATLVALWSARLGAYLCRRVMGHHPEEDGRYKEMRVRWAGKFHREMFKFYQLQAASVVVLAIPFLLAVCRSEPRFAALDWIALALFAISQTGEALADAQLARFKKKSRQQRPRLRHRPLVRQPPSQLLLCLAHVAELRALRPPHRLGLARPDRARVDPLPPPLRQPASP